MFYIYINIYATTQHTNVLWHPNWKTLLKAWKDCVTSFVADLWTDFVVCLDSNSATVTVHLIDINDNAPELDESRKEIEIFNDFSFASVRKTTL